MIRFSTKILPPCQVEIRPEAEANISGRILLLFLKASSLFITNFITTMAKNLSQIGLKVELFGRVGDAEAIR